MTANNFLQNFNTHSNYLKAFAMKLTRDKNSADDLFQETALSAFRHQSKFENNTNMKAWLCTIMKNSFINFYRKNKRRSEVQDFSKDEYLINSSHNTIGNEGEINVNVDELTAIIDNLDEGYRVPFLMAYQGYQYDEIEEAMGNLPMGTVKSRIHHARRILKEKINALYN